ncbi:hypothetical protein UCDDA912_g10631 [Diaporthe ampelina]|uniref:Uncharacterized protein n=1 Tax=Diaporthe ampelina TaxID=1214573 RepID=A0A0G2HMG0_9PEZI|nr:hypothetical protein UCDDA912_g10631 [Diaporthe ampelina]
MLRRLDFENDAVAWRAANPSSFGYHHGPVPYWHQQQLANAVETANQPLPFPPITVSKVNTGVCDVELDGTGSMCGTVFHNQPSLRRHLRDAHPGAAHNPTRVNVGIMEKLHGENAIKRWVLTGGWRDAGYVREPGRGPEGGLVAQYADACERIAGEDAEFRNKFGGVFHRRIMQESPDFQPGRKARARPRQPAAPAAQPSPPRAGPSPSARPRNRQGGQGRVRDVRAQEAIFVSDDEDGEDAGVMDEQSP